MATTATARRTRRAAQPAPQNVTTRRGGKIHATNTALDWPFPRCRTGAQTRQPTHGRYVATTDAVTCEKCLGANEGPEPGGAAPERASTTRRADKTSPRASRARRNGAVQQEAAEQATAIVADETAKVLAKRGTHAEMNAQRNPKCSDDDYALAVRVRELRAAGEAWWRIAQTLGLPGAGASAKQGKTGAAHARGLWKKAWGETYRDTSVQRETRAIKTERALTQPGRPYFGAEEDSYVVAAVTGHEIEWVTRVGAGDGVVCSIQRAEVSPEARVDVVQGPKGRVLRFYEIIRDEKGIPMVGPLRSVYIDRIERVGK